MKAYLDIKKDKSEIKINIVNGFDAKEDLKARGYCFEPQAILDHSTNKVVDGWRRELQYAEARAEMAWLASIGIKCEQGVVY